MRQCPKCREVKQWEDFPLSKATPTGRDYKCKECHRVAWHARKPQSRDIHVFSSFFELNQESLSEIMTLENGSLRWKVNTSRTRAGDIAGTREGNRSARVFINGKRYPVADLIEMLTVGAITERKTKEPRNVVYEAEWMREIRSGRTFFDWGIVWKREIENKKAIDKYNSPEAMYERACYAEILQHGMKSVHPDWSILWSRSRMAMSPEQKAIDNLRSRLRDITKRAKRGASSRKSLFIGCSTKQFKEHIQSQFKRGMTWGNYGTHWHVDHILPCASFDHANQNHVKQCWHYSNLAPLEAKKNLAKSDTITQPQMSLCLSH